MNTAMPLPETTAPAIERVDIYVNERASNYDAERTAQRREAFARLFDLSAADVQLITERPSSAIVSELHSDFRPPKRLSVSQSGDGGALALVEASYEYLDSLLDEPEDPEAQTAFTVPLLAFDGTGNGLNLHKSLNGAAHAANLPGLLASGKATAGLFHATECEMPDGKKRYAGSIIQLGVTDHIAGGLEGQRTFFKHLPKAVRFAGEAAITAWYSTTYRQRFRVEAEGLGEALHRKTLAGLDLITMPRVAKIGRAPVSALGPDLFAMQTELPGSAPIRLGRAVAGGLRLMAGFPAGNRAEFPEDGAIALRIADATGPIGVGFDGEKGFYLNTGDELRLRQARFGLPVICNRSVLS